MTVTERLILFNLAGITPLAFRKLMDKYGALNNIKQEDIEKLSNSKKNLHKELDEELKMLKKYEVRVVTIMDEEYPSSLKYISDPPYVLYVKGTLKPEDGISIGIVGCRNPTNYGKICAEKFTLRLIERGFTVISGLARGVDTVCHSAAVGVKGRNIAVLGSGFGKLYPPENRNLAKEITTSGAVISEFSMLTEPDKFNFPRRNRIISGMTLGTLVIEAGEKSGALITARYALEQNREVFALPGNITSEESKGPNGLIKQGAKLVMSVEDILEELKDVLPEEFLNKKGQAELETVALSDLENKVFSVINNETAHIDEIINITKIEAGPLATALINLEIKGFIKQFPGKMFVKM
ncbi:MAG: DNA protecting protein DprA [Candidatus Firestonebacteria bacterium RifOxyC12_full_39_7]|nr:MAG: DNA protecting protein DprA [Candidatus Firestonebacteria bacterium RifOxyC12_full_39_7]